MEFINTFEGIQSLPIGTKVYKVINGHYREFKVYGGEPKQNIITIHEEGSLKWFSDKDFSKIIEKNGKFTLSFEFEEIGELMIQQTKEFGESEIKRIIELVKTEIESITAVYLKK